MTGFPWVAFDRRLVDGLKELVSFILVAYCIASDHSRLTGTKIVDANPIPVI